jgi:hypothetical protein
MVVASCVDLVTCVALVSGNLMLPINVQLPMILVGIIGNQYCLWKIEKETNIFIKSIMIKINHNIYI